MPKEYEFTKNPFTGKVTGLREVEPNGCGPFIVLIVLALLAIGAVLYGLVWGAVEIVGFVQYGSFDQNVVHERAIAQGEANGIYEAEMYQSGGGYVEGCGKCSNRAMVYDMTQSAKLDFHIKVEKAGAYKISLFYCSIVPMKGSVSVNQGENISVTLPAGEGLGWDEGTPSQVDIFTTLKSGDNEISLIDFNIAKSGFPQLGIDKIEVHFHVNS